MAIAVTERRLPLLAATSVVYSKFSESERQQMSSLRGREEISSTLIAGCRARDSREKAFVESWRMLYLCTFYVCSGLEVLSVCCPSKKGFDFFMDVYDLYSEEIVPDIKLL